MVCWHLLPSDYSCVWTSGDRAGQTRQECLKWGSRANQETASCVQHGLSKSLELLFWKPWWIYVLSDNVLYLDRAVYLTLSSRVVSFRMSLAKRWHWLLTDLNPPHRKLTALKWVRNRRRSPLNTLFLFHDMIELKKHVQNFPKKDNLLTISAWILTYWPPMLPFSARCLCADSGLQLSELCSYDVIVC